MKYFSVRPEVATVALAAAAILGFVGGIYFRVHIPQRNPSSQAAVPGWPNPILDARNTKKITPHVYVIPDGNIPAAPNVGIIVGTRASFVIDTGMGRRNGETILQEVAKVGKRSQLLVAFTHFHPDHTTGASAFPRWAPMIMSSGAAADIAEFGPTMASDFTAYSPNYAALLQGSPYPEPTILVSQPTEFDLGGGVTVTAIPVGANHTRGDMVYLVKPGNILFTGDVVMAGVPQIASPYSTIGHWLQTLALLEGFKPSIIVPDHGRLGDAGLITGYRSYFETILRRTAELKAQGKTSDQAVAILREELRPGFADADYRGVWSWDDRMTGSVAQAYKEAPSARHGK